VNFEAVLENLPLYLDGLAETLRLAVLAVVIGGLAAVPLAMLRAARSRWLHGPVRLFTFVLRGTPLLVQMFIVYYGLAQFDVVRDSAAWSLLQNARFCAVLAFALNTCAYTTEIFAGAILATSAGEVEAARALGMQPFTLWRRIVWPQALRRSLPAYSNEVIMMLHATSLASVVTLQDLTGAARDVYARSYLPIEAFLTAAAFYLVLTFALVAVFRAAERRWTAYLLPRQ